MPAGTTTMDSPPWSMERESQRPSTFYDVSSLDKDDAKVTKYLIFMVGALSIGGFLFGYNLANINIPEAVIRGPLNDTHVTSPLPPSIPMSDVLWGLAVAMLPLGGLVGSLAGGKMAELLGRKWLLFISSVSFILAALIMAVALEQAMFIIGRILVGISCGISATVIPGYLSEISPKAVRGQIGTSFQFSICLGTLVATIISIPLDTFVGWRILVGLTGLPAILQLLLLPLMVESPRWLMMKGDMIRSRACLETLRGTKGISSGSGTKRLSKNKPNIPTTTITAETLAAQPKQTTTSSRTESGLSPEEEILSRIPLEDLDTSEAIAAAMAVRRSQDVSSMKPMGFKEFFGTPSVIRALGVGIILHLAQQLSGVNAIFYYSTRTFQEAYHDKSKYITLGIGIVNMVSVTISAFVMDYFGRRLLLLLGQIAMCVSLVVLTLGFVFKVYPLLIVFVLIFVFAYSASAGAVTWVMTGELFPTRAFGIAASIAVAVNWLSNFAVGMAFPPLNVVLRAYSFLPFVGFLVLFFILTMIYVPETKGKSLEEITIEFQRATSDT
jgi:MFS family permease